MKSQLIAIVAAVVLVGCGPSVDIHEAAKTGNIEAVKQHLDAGVDVNLKNWEGKTPLDLAISNKQAEIADLLLRHGGKAKTPKNISIHNAAKPGNIAAIKWCLAAGVNIDAKDKYGSTPLHCAVMNEGIAAHTRDGSWTKDDIFDLRQNLKQTVRLLIAKGADVNAKRDDGKTPLHEAAFKGHNAIVELLIEKGADVNVQTDDGYTPFDFATLSETDELLRKHGGKTGEELKAEGK